jgi:excisionase family DNA binding protein
VTHVTISTEDDARRCVVSADTIIKWISESVLPAERTTRGAYRVRVDDLLEFMATHGMQPESSKAETRRSPLCWEYWSAAGAGWTPGGIPATCVECPVYLSRAMLCFELRPLLPGGIKRAGSCDDCDFFVASDQSVRAEG